MNIQNETGSNLLTSLEEVIEWFTNKTLQPMTDDIEDELNKIHNITIRKIHSLIERSPAQLQTNLHACTPHQMHQTAIISETTPLQEAKRLNSTGWLHEGDGCYTSYLRDDFEKVIVDDNYDGSWWVPDISPIEFFVSWMLGHLATSSTYVESRWTYVGHSAYQWPELENIMNSWPTFWRRPFVRTELETNDDYWYLSPTNNLILGKHWDRQYVLYDASKINDEESCIINLFR